MTSESEHNRAGGWRSRIKQLLHWATGDRAGEGRALSEQAGSAVSDRDATDAVRRVHGDLGLPDTSVPEPTGEINRDDERGDIATPSDAQAEHDRH